MSGIEIKSGNEFIDFGVMNIPNRKSKALYVRRGAMIDVLAYFTSEENAKRFNKIIDFTIEAYRKSQALSKRK